MFVADLCDTVLLPSLVNEMFSGVFTGRRSALYLLVRGAAMREALEMQPRPVPVPRNLAEHIQGAPGLLQRWLVGAVRGDL